MKAGRSQGDIFFQSSHFIDGATEVQRLHFFIDGATAVQTPVSWGLTPSYWVSDGGIEPDTQTLWFPNTVFSAQYTQGVCWARLRVSSEDDSTLSSGHRNRGSAKHPQRRGRQWKSSDHSINRQNTTFLKVELTFPLLLPLSRFSRVQLCATP